LIKEEKDALVDYLSFLMHFLQFDLKVPHFETFIWWSLWIIKEIILSGAFDNGVLFEIIPPLFKKVCEIVDLRYNNEASMLLVFPLKD